MKCLIQLLLFLSLSILASTACRSSKDLHQETSEESAAVSSSTHVATADSVRTSYTSWFENLTFRDIVIEEMPLEVDSGHHESSGIECPKIRTPCRRITIGEASVSSHRQRSDSAAFHLAQSDTTFTAENTIEVNSFDCKEETSSKSAIPPLLVIVVVAIAFMLIRKYVDSN